MWNLTWAALLALVAVISLSLPVTADDTEIFQAEVRGAASARPKVLIVFDDSGSMSFEVDQQRPSYNANGQYENRFGTDRIYWSTSGSVPGEGSDNWFNASQNRCASSYVSLQNNGSFQTSAARRWVDSQTVEGDCSLECPDGTTYRRGDEGRACYEYTTYTVTEQQCTDTWIRVDEDVWDDHRPKRDRRDYEETIRVCEEEERCGWVYIDGPRWSWNSYEYQCRVEQECEWEEVDVYEIRQEVCEDVQVEVTDWRYVQERVQICEDVSVIPGTWQALDDDVRNPPHVDCRNDVDTANAGNGNIPDGYPQNNVATGSEYGSTPDASTALWGEQPYTFYTSHYLNWYHDDSLVEARPRLDIAQEVVTQLIRTNPGIDFGLMEFNFDQGGRVVQRIIDNMSEDQRDNLVDLVNRIDHAGSTPLCESMYEAFRYISGGEVLYGTQSQSGSDSRGTYDVLSRDRLAERDGSYLSPMTDCAYTYVILMTDGEPQRDTDANSRIRALTGNSCEEYRDADGRMTENCFPQLAEYMANTDLDNDSSNGNQYAITYTIGFTTNQKLLSDAAEAGKGEYYTANNAQELTEAFQGAIYSILSTDTTFTSPAVAVDSFTRTRSRDEIFYSMFRPTERLDWRGNIKKLKLQESDEGVVLVDANDNAAIDPSTGFIKETATTFWSSGQDGGSVDAGGVGGRLAARNPATRSIYIDSGANQALEAFTASNLAPQDFGLASNAALWALFGANTEAAFESQVAWGRGFDVDDRDGDGVTNEPREWILGDILHSQPLVVNYGATSGFSEQNPDLRIIVGTNAGFVHMFGSADGDEDWAFLPKALVDLLPQRRRNPVTSDNVYGMDLTPVIYRRDVDQDGTIEPADGDKVYVYMGMRRGGRSLYALDITNPDSPRFLWSVSPATTGFAELGQTWSQPTVTLIPGYRDGDGVAKPVLVFGAGYDDRKDAGGVATPDSMGRGLFMVDAENGDLIWSVTPNVADAKNMQETDLLHSVAAEVTVIDSNRDGFSDRIYFGDTGGNVWRVDMPGNSLPDADQDTWFIVKLAQVNGRTAASDRRIHNGIDVVQTRFGGKAVDAVIFATGDRSNPNATDVQNRLYMIRDEAVATYTVPEPTAEECGDEEFEGDFRCRLPITDAQLYNVTSNALDLEEGESVFDTLASKNGWRMDFAGMGEKGLSKTLTLDGKIYATTFTPNDLLSDINICEPLSGSGKLYIVNLLDGDRRVINLAPVIPDTPSVHFGADGQVRLLLPPGTPRGDTDGDGEDNCEGGVCEIGMMLRGPYGDHWFQEDY